MPDQGGHDVMVRHGPGAAPLRTRQDEGAEGAGEGRWLSANYVA